MRARPNLTTRLFEEESDASVLATHVLPSKNATAPQMCKSHSLQTSPPQSPSHSFLFPPSCSISPCQIKSRNRSCPHSPFELITSLKNISTIIIRSIFLLSYRKMNSARNKSSSLYDQSNNEMRRKIIGSTMLQGQPQPEREVLPKRVNNTTHGEIRQETVRESTDRNMKFKLQQLEDKLQEFLNDLRGVRQENRELIQFTKLLKQNLVYEDLFTLKTQMDQKLTGLSNHIRSTKHNNEQRYGQIYSECSDLWKRTEQVRQNVFNLQMRVQRLEQKMGFNENYRPAQL